MALHQAELPDMAQNMTTQIIQLIDQNTIITDFLEQFADTRQCNKQIVDLNRVIETIFEHAACSMNDVVLKFNLFERTIQVAVDAEKISRAARALLDNAYQALLERKGMILVSTDIVNMVNGSCEFYGLPAGEYARLTVTDDGVGMEKDVLTQVFEPFFSGDKGCHPERKGLGLTLARNIVESHGGTIDIWSTPGRGSTFSINLPLGYFEKAVSEVTAE
nr:ATP-binding protein [uncultured Desulfobacter sp.]